MWVIKRPFAQMLAWPFTGQLPSQCRQVPRPKRRGPVLNGPSLTVDEQERFFRHLQLASEYASAPKSAAEESRNTLLRRQAYYLCGWSTNPRTRAWLTEMQRAERHRVRQAGEWSPSWVVDRSLVVALARQGDPEPLRHFIRTDLASDECESANLNYWAYWVGETSGTEASDEFMAHALGPWQGRTLLSKLFDNLTPTNTCLDLDVHSIWSLLQCRPRLLDDSADVGNALARVENLLDSGVGSPQASQELAHVRRFLRSYDQRPLQPERGPRMSDHDVDPGLDAIASFLYEMGLLKRVKRAGWLVAGVANPETIAEHTFRTAIIGYVLAMLEGADPAKTVLLCLFHDTQETRTGDVAYVGRRYVTTAPNVEVTSDQVANFPLAIGDAVQSLVGEYEARTSLEAKIAKDADKLECLVQAREYQAQGYEHVPPWVETSAAGLHSQSARRLADACQQISPKEWWKPLNEAYAAHRVHPRNPSI